LILVRHGETAANREMRYIGSRDDELTERGHQQAQQVADALAALPLSAIYASPRRRTQATAQPIAARSGLPIVVADELRENAFGVWEGLSRAEVLAHSAEYATQLQDWEADPTIAPPGGESIAAMVARVEVFAADLTLGVAPGVVQRMFLDPATISVIDWTGAQRMLRLFNSHAHLGWSNARWMEA
jgi:probable phosphoglycerate mutase